MQAVCPDDKIKPLRLAGVECDVHSLLGLFERPDGVPEDGGNVVPAGLIDDLGPQRWHPI
jgi:hypothetical protein